MAGIDHSIYFQYKPADLFGAVVDGAKTGMDLKNQVSQNQWQQSERERLQKENERKLQEQTWNDEMMKARNSSLVRGADGSVTLDNALYKNNLYNLTGSGNLLAGQQYQTLNQDILNQQAAEAKRQQDAQKFAGDQRLQNAQIGKLEAERRELLRKPTDRTGANLPLDQKKVVETLATKNANKIAIKNQIDAVMSNWDDLSDDQKVASGRQLLKTLNSTEGADAIGSEEANRLGSKLEFAMGNFTNSNPTQFGRDLSGFAEQARNTAKSIGSAVDKNQERVNELMGRPSGKIRKSQQSATVFKGSEIEW